MVMASLTFQFFRDICRIQLRQCSCTPLILNIKNTTNSAEHCPTPLTGVLTVSVGDKTLLIQAVSLEPEVLSR